MAPLDAATTVFLTETSRLVTEALNGSLVGIYPSGSLAWGDYQPGISDVDLLVVSAASLSTEEKLCLVDALSHIPRHDDIGGLDLVSASRATVTDPEVSRGEELAFEAFRDNGWTPDHDLDGWPHSGLGLAVEIVRVTGSVFSGPAPDYFATVAPTLLVEACRGELDWWLSQETIVWPRTAVLNACRAWRYVSEGVLSSKVQGGRWAWGRMGSTDLIDKALAQQLGTGDEVIADAEARAFVSEVAHLISGSSHEPS